jgi:hypothetical protein
MPDKSAQDHKHPPIPEAMTPPGWSFQRENDRIVGFVFYITQLATLMDERTRVAVRALYESKDPEKCREALENVEKQGAVQALRKLHSRMILEMMLSRAVENFLAYVTELLTLVFRSRPETLRSSETVRLDAILQHGTMEELIRDLAERRVNQLSYQGMRDLAAYLSHRLGFELFSDPEHLERAIGIIECRNIIVHNRGRVNEVFRSRVPSVPAAVGDPLEIDTDQIFENLEFLALSVYDADARAVQKFTLSAVPGPTAPAPAQT